MPRLMLILILTLLSSLSTGCARGPVKTELDSLYEQNFKDLAVPSPAAVKAEGAMKEYPHVTYDEVWDASIFLLMQKGIIARADKGNGEVVLMTTPPFTLLIENVSPVKVYLKWMDDLYRKVGDGTSGATLAFTLENKQKLAQNLFDKMATEVYASQKWKYLFPGRE